MLFEIHVDGLMMMVVCGVSCDASKHIGAVEHPFTDLKIFNTKPISVQQVPLELACMIVHISMEGWYNKSYRMVVGMRPKGTLVNCLGKCTCNVITYTQPRAIDLQEPVQVGEGILHPEHEVNEVGVRRWGRH